MAVDPYIARGMPDLGANALMQVQQGRDNQRRNALMNLNERQFDFQKQRYDAADQARQQEAQAAQDAERRKFTAIRAATGDANARAELLQTLGWPTEILDDPDAESVNDIFKTLAIESLGLQQLLICRLRKLPANLKGLDAGYRVDNIIVVYTVSLVANMLRKSRLVLPCKNGIKQHGRLIRREVIRVQRRHHQPAAVFVAIFNPQPDGLQAHAAEIHTI